MRHVPEISKAVPYKENPGSVCFLCMGNKGEPEEEANNESKFIHPDHKKTMVRI